MKYKIFSLLRKIFSAVIALLMPLFSCGDEQPEPVRPDAGAVTAYDTASADYSLKINSDSRLHPISETLFGAFFEDINFAADGGLYAEMVKNRSFEFTALAENDAMHGWSKVGDVEAEVICDDIDGALNENNTSYLVLRNTSAFAAGVENIGFLDGMAVSKDKSYSFSVYSKGIDGYNGALYAEICVDGQAVGTGKTEHIGSGWQKYEFEITTSVSASENVSLRILIDNGSAAVDMVSLFPSDTFKGRENGMRSDLAEMLAELEPAFLRFPGGCVIEGIDAQTAYSWKNSVGVGRNGEPLLFNGKYGDVAARKQGINLWTDLSATEDKNPCFMSYGLGFYEYFLLAEDIGAVGVPVLNCGLYCQMRGRGGVDMSSPEFAGYIRDMLDLVDFCRGNEASQWGKVRASMGHPEPFELKYICIGNENEGEDYYERYTAFLNAFLAAKEENPEMYEGLELIYSAGASDATHSGNYVKSYEYAQNWLKNNPGKTVEDFAGATDQHYYNDPEWFLSNTDYYDENNYQRSAEKMTDTFYGGGIGVFLGEYAARSNTLRAALAEAAYMTGLERNGDIVKMAAYAPLFGNLTATHWSPDLIWFNNNCCTGSISYYVQKLFSRNAGNMLLSSELIGAKIEQPDLSGRVGVGTWYTAAEFDNVMVTDNLSGEILAEDNFSVSNFLWNWSPETDGEFKIRNGVLKQTSTDMDYSLTGSVAYFGSDSMSNYTYTLDAKKTAGDEGFLIPIAVKDTDNNYFWNIGGWHNTLSCLQQIDDGVKAGQLPGTVRDFTVETGKTYNLKVEVDGTRIRCYIDGELYIDYQTASESLAEVYEVVSTDESGDIIIKLVNTTDTNRVFSIEIESEKDISGTAYVSVLSGDSPANDNILGEAEDCIINEMTVDGISRNFNYTVAQYSVTVIRIPA